MLLLSSSLLCVAMQVLLAGRLSQPQAKLAALVKSLGGTVVKGTHINASTSLVVVKDEEGSSCTFRVWNWDSFLPLHHHWYTGMLLVGERATVLRCFLCRQRTSLTHGRTTFQW